MDHIFKFCNILRSNKEKYIYFSSTKLIFYKFRFSKLKKLTWQPFKKKKLEETTDQNMDFRNLMAALDINFTNVNDILIPNR